MTNDSERLREIAFALPSVNVIAVQKELFDLADRLEWHYVAKEGNPKKSGWYEVILNTGKYSWPDYRNFYSKLDKWDSQLFVAAYRKPLEPAETKD